MPTVAAAAPPDARAGATAVRLGRVDYVNVLPVYMGLDEEGTRCEVVRGVPTELNALLRSGDVDCAPVSAIEVAHAQGAYAMLEGLSISSDGPVGSSLLIGRVPPERLDGRRVALTTHSAASLAYFRILCSRLWNVSPQAVDAVPDLDGMLTVNDACVLIGNPAIRAAHAARGRRDLVVTDLGAAWKELTGLPCIFAVWALRRSWAQARPDGVGVLAEDLERGRRWGHDPANRAALDARGAEETGIDVAAAHAYFDLQDYRMTPAHREGLTRFLAECAALGLAPTAPALEFVS